MLHICKPIAPYFSNYVLHTIPMHLTLATLGLLAIIRWGKVGVLISDPICLTLLVSNPIRNCLRLVLTLTGIPLKPFSDGRSRCVYPYKISLAPLEYSTVPSINSCSTSFISEHYLLLHEATYYLSEWLWLDVRLYILHIHLCDCTSVKICTMFAVISLPAKCQVLIHELASVICILKRSL